ncbi:hypothetical protein DVH24_001566 [Malus domestica]|uniref:Uncharacterized protein n=1 Tax=Malus domestica TaxID=3750 RepID=A0A498K7K3_MALDO|nr:hypothetical protein DVH24_001566 [Malus domestica]
MLHCTSTTNLIAQGQALLDGLKAARKGIFLLGCGDGDSNVPLSTLEAEIQKLACYLQDISFRHIFRESSFVVDALTNVGHLSSNVHMRWQNLPVEARPTWFWDFYRHA